VKISDLVGKESGYKHTDSIVIL